MSAFAAQVRAETFMTLRRGETLLLTIGIPVVFLVFFSTVHVVAVRGRPITFFVPGVLALAIMSTSMVSLGSATGFERGYGVLKRLGSTPLGRPRLVGAKITAVLLVEVVQAIVLVAVGFGLGWDPAGSGAPAALALALLATAAFGGIGLLLAGLLRAEVNLAAVNGLYLVLLLLGGMIVPLAKLPAALADIAKILPSGAVSLGLHSAIGAGASVGARTWATLAAWAVLAPLAAAITFRWE